jgi:hypothetical protein
MNDLHEVQKKSLNSKKLNSIYPGILKEFIKNEELVL